MQKCAVGSADFVFHVESKMLSIFLTCKLYMPMVTILK